MSEIISAGVLHAVVAASVFAAFLWGFACGRRVQKQEDETDHMAERMRDEIRGRLWKKKIAAREWWWEALYLALDTP
jgi:hypothetical protein